MNENIADQFERILGAQQVITHGDKLTSACLDFFGHWQGNAEAILFPSNTEQVAACLRICTQHRISVTVQGGKTGLQFV